MMMMLFQINRSITKPNDLIGLRLRVNQKLWNFYKLG